MQRVQPDLVPTQWQAFEPWLIPAIEHDPKASVAEVYRRLCDGNALLFKVDRWDAKGAAILEVAEEGDRLTCWVTFIGGWVNGGPKERLRFFRGELAKIEQIARDAGCSEIVIGGRDWSRVFPDYTRRDDLTNGLRKVLAHG